MAWLSEKNRRIFLLAIHPSFFKTTQQISKRLLEQNLPVIHPSTISTFVKLSNANDIIVTLYFTENKVFRNTLAKLEQQGATMIDTFSQMQLTNDRVRTFKLLQKHGINVPHYFFGYPEKIPAILGSNLVKKDLHGHGVLRVSKKDLISRTNKELYVEERLSNPEKTVRCVMYIFGKIYTRIKKDQFHNKSILTAEREPVVPPTELEVSLAHEVHRITNMQLFNIDLIRNIVIEINCCPNFFSYNPAIFHFTRNLQSIIDEKSTHK